MKFFLILNHFYFHTGEIHAMSHKVISHDPLSLLFYESEAYSSLEEIEKLVQGGHDLSCVPIQPLYLALKNAPLDQVANCLPKLDQEQRQVLLDLDFWERDELDLDNFTFWLQAYLKCPDEKVQLEFVHGNTFALYLKAKFNVWTFDVEEPEYPDHDNFFLTDDQLLVFEFEEDYPYVEKVQALLRMLYGDLGVENAYSYLFKITCDSFLNFQEEELEQKKSRLMDYGFVDYYDALAIKSAYPSLKHLNSFINEKILSTGTIDEVGTNQALHPSTLVAYRKGLDTIKEELVKVKSQKRKDYLHFNFIRLVNASTSSSNALKSGSINLAKVGNETKILVLLGFHYLSEMVNEKFAKDERFSEGLFGCFEFVELYKIGNTLVFLNQKRIKKGLGATPFEDEDKEYFLGDYWSQFLELSFSSPVKYGMKKDKSSESQEIDTMEKYKSWNADCELLLALLPFINKFYKTLDSLKEEHKINDHHYLNYSANSIDFEAILISSFINFSLGKFKDLSIQKMGVTLQEFEQFMSEFGVKDSKNNTNLLPQETAFFHQKLLQFKMSFGFAELENIENYLFKILDQQLSGYELEKLSYEEFEHVGGPILLRTQE